MPPRSTASTVRFLLDENLSHRAGSALILCDYDVAHVVLEEEDLGRGTPDEDIVPWCGRTGHVWVTTDDDARGRPIRFALLPKHGVHAIILDPQPQGIRAQLGRIVRFYDAWVRELSKQPAGSHNVWVQSTRGVLRPLWKRKQ
jgi:hypothetical protein